MTTPALLLCVLLIAGITLFPFDFQRAPAGIGEVPATKRPLDLHTRDIVLNALLFVPAGALLQSALGRGRSRRQAVLLAGAAACLLSAAVESAQWLLPRRDPSLLDVGSNTTGALAGAYWYSRWGAESARRWARGRDRLPLSAALVAMALFTVCALLLSAVLQRRARPGGWSLEYPLLVGNELTGDRPWRGRLYLFQLTDRATPAAAMHRFAGGAPVAPPGRAIVDLDFGGGLPHPDAPGLTPRLRWTATPTGPESSGAVTLPGIPWMHSEGPVPAVAERVLKSGAFTARLVCATDDEEQYGPARIVSNSINIGLRNFTFGQHGRDLVVRFRSPHTGPNGSRPEVIVPRVFAAGVRRDILVSYDGGALVAALAGSGRVSRVELGPGSSLAAAVTSLPIRASELWALQTMYVALLFTAGASLLHALAAPARRRVVLGLVWVPVFSFLLEGAAVAVTGRALDVQNIAASIAIGLLALTPSLPAPRRRFARVKVH